MATPAIDNKQLTHEEYFALEEELGQKFEYIAGEVFAMAGGSVNHALIASNTVLSLGVAFRASPCLVLGSDAKLFIQDEDSFYYPDAVVTCESPQDERYIQSPQIIVEVLSPSTADYDHGKKFAAYRLLPSLQTYIMLHQDKPLAEVYQRQPDNSWLLREYNDLEAVITLDNELTLALTDLYLKVDFQALASPQPETAEA